MAQVKLWIVSALGEPPAPLGVRPTVLPGPVVVTRLVIVPETKVPKTADGERAPETAIEARERGVVSAVSSVKRALFSFVRGLGPGIRVVAMDERARVMVRTPVKRVRSVGARLRSVGQRARCQVAERWVLL